MHSLNMYTHLLLMSPIKKVIAANMRKRGGSRSKTAKRKKCEIMVKDQGERGNQISDRGGAGVGRGLPFVIAQELVLERVN